MSDTPNNGHCQQNLRRVVISSLIGAVIEWYDFFLYGVVAGIVFNKIYFPDFDPTVGTVLAFATFAVGFVARPLGGIVFGHFGDKLGRKKMLVLTLEIMGVATVGIGLVPSYETIGIWAPILLVLCRLAQGIGIGGEWGGAVLMAFESAPPHKRAFYGSLPQVGLALGLMLASGVIGLLSFFLSDEAFLAWGWRVAFILSAILVGVGAYIRISVQETQDFSSAKKKTEQVKYPILAAFKHYPRTLTACVGARFVEGIAFNVSDQLLRPGQDREPVRHRGRRRGHGRGHPLLGHAGRYLGPRAHLRHRRHPAGHHRLSHLLGAAQLQPE